MALSPMMKQYQKIKQAHQDCIVLFRLGDFYEMFFDDAIVASKVLDLILTGRDCGLEERAPMCGVPHHSVSTYISRLIEAGHKVAICEQVTEPKAGTIVERQVTKIITRGTVTNSDMLIETENNFICCMFYVQQSVGIAWCDITTGEFSFAEFSKNAYKKLEELLLVIAPKEIICNLEMHENKHIIPQRVQDILPQLYVSYSPDFEYQIALKNLHERLGQDLFDHQEKLGICAAGALIAYIRQTQKSEPEQITSISSSFTQAKMHLDYVTRKNLELTESIKERNKRFSLFSVLNKTCSAGGARLLKQWVENPLFDHNLINYRLDAVQELHKNTVLLGNLMTTLKGFKDITRLATKLSSRDLLPQHCQTIAHSAALFPTFKQLLQHTNAQLLQQIHQEIGDFSEIVDLLHNAICEQPSNDLKEGGYIKTGFDATLDSYKEIIAHGKDRLIKLEQVEREETGIKNLRINHNKVFGYYIEVSKGQLGLVPYRYTRKQTVANGERYITEELKALEEEISTANASIIAHEQLLYAKVCSKLRKHVTALIQSANNISLLDCICALAQAAQEGNYCRPVINDSLTHIKITDGRHPVIEKYGTEPFVPNNTLLDNQDSQTLIITGPNMAGKSTYMRQVALITVMAHIGSFVPASKAEIALCDRIFTRIGASDEIALGQSTFMVEMTEMADILSNATQHSLLILDEIGRGTSTYDGLSIAWAIIEHIAQNLNVKTLFSTHFHELTELEGSYKGIKNYRATVKEHEGSIVFLHKIARGSALKSFGIEVAELAGIPQNVLTRARKILKKLEQADIMKSNPISPSNQLSMFLNSTETEIYNILKEADQHSLTQEKAQQLLFDLIARAKAGV